MSTESDWWIALGKMLKERREAAGASLQDVAQVAEIPVTRLTRIESGAGIPIRPSEVAAILSGVDAHVDLKDAWLARIQFAALLPSAHTDDLCFELVQRILIDARVTDENIAAVWPEFRVALWGAPAEPASLMLRANLRRAVKQTLPALLAAILHHAARRALPYDERLAVVREEAWIRGLLEGVDPDYTRTVYGLAADYFEASLNLAAHPPPTSSSSTSDTSTDPHPTPQRGDEPATVAGDAPGTTADAAADSDRHRGEAGRA